jgi:DNA-binding protein YbaB
MAFALDDQIERATAELREQGERIRNFQAGLQQQATTVVSKDRMVTVTVNGTGKVTELSIKGNRYRTMPAAELSNLVRETVNQALEKASAETMAAARALMPGDFGSFGIGDDGTVDIDRLLKVAMDKVDDPALRWSNGKGGAA